jgi:transcriptional antiterminator NusG
MSKKWYVIQTLSGSEKRAQKSLNKAIENAPEYIQDRFGEVLIPEEELTEIRNGEKKTSRRIKIPGYIFLEVDLSNDPDNEVEILIKNTNRIVEIKKTPLRPIELDRLLGRAKKEKAPSKVLVKFSVGDSVKITGGAFSGMTGIVEDVNTTRQRLRVRVSIFGRMTSVDLEYTHVEESDARNTK